MIRPLQQQLKLRLYNRGVRPSGESYKDRGGHVKASNGNFVDIESFLTYPVTYSEEASLLNTLSFTIQKDSDILLHRLSLGQWVVLYGGYYSSDGSGVRKVFSGTITRIKTEFKDDGVVLIKVECMSYGFTKMGKNQKNFIYPDKDSRRSFCKGKTSISLSDLIKGIAKECDMEIGELVLPNVVANHVFTETSTRVQKEASDWKFLNDLASQFGCSMWTENSSGVEKLFFVDKSKSMRTTGSEIGFIYPLYKANYKVNANEIIRQPDSLWNRPRLIRDVTVDEDISLAYAVSRSAMYFDMKTGEQKESIAEVSEEDGKKVITFYELDESRVEAVNQERPDIAEQIREMGATEVPWSSGCEKAEQETPEYARYYYKAVKRVSEDVAVFDQAFFGIYVTCTCNMDLDIRSQMIYPIRGLIRYSSSNDTGNYFLRGLKHIWDFDGMKTELDFIK